MSLQVSSYIAVVEIMAINKSTKQIEKSIVISKDNIKELMFEINIMYGTPSLQMAFNDISNFFSGQYVADFDLYVKVNAIGKEYAPTVSPVLKIVSWNMMSSGIVVINLAVSPLYMTLLRDNTLKVYPKTNPLTNIYSDVITRNNGNPQISNFFGFETLSKDIIQCDDSLSFIKNTLLPLSYSNSLQHNYFKFMTGESVFFLTPCMLSSKPSFRVIMGTKVGAYADEGEKTIYTTEWSDTFSYRFSDNTQFPTFFDYDTKTGTFTKKEFTKSMLNFTNLKSFNYNNLNPYNQELIDTPKRMKEYQTIEEFNQNFGITIYTPINAVFQPNVNYYFDTRISKDTKANAFYNGNVWVYSVAHYFVNHGETNQATTILKGVMNSHNMTTTQIVEAKVNGEGYTV